MKIWRPNIVFHEVILFQKLDEAVYISSDAVPGHFEPPLELTNDLLRGRTLRQLSPYGGCDGIQLKQRLASDFKHGLAVGSRHCARYTAYLHICVVPLCFLAALGAGRAQTHMRLKLLLRRRTTSNHKQANCLSTLR